MNKKVYVFLTHTIGGLSGGPTYVRNKRLWLQQHGWEVVLFDGTGEANHPVILEEFKEYASNRFKELYFSPFCFRKYRRKRVLERVQNIIPRYDTIVIESNNPSMALWGEMLSSRIHAKHIVFLLGENEKIDSRALYEFYNYKLNHDELFCIAPKAVSALFGDYEPEIDAEKYYWNASNSAPVGNVECPKLDEIASAKYNIGYFGRKKPYMDEVIRSVVAFSQQHKSDSINFIVLGCDKLPSEQQEALNISNFNVYLIASQSVIPSRFFSLTDVVIGNAACARIAFQEGSKVVTMNVETKQPLGVFGYTTDQVSFESENYRDKRTLLEILNDVLVAGKYDNVKPIIEIPAQTKGFEYQELFALKEKSEPYKGIDKLQRPKSLANWCKYLLLNAGLVSYLSERRYKLYKQ